MSSSEAGAGILGSRGLGIVIIGRNEGDRLTACLRSARACSGPLVYVDSGSTDGSVENARSFGADVVELEMSLPFTAARARNTGFARLTELLPQLEYVQFLDGDCELLPGWLDAGIRALVADSRRVGVCGRIQERHPERSVYNALCQAEWDRPAGPVEWCGGNAMMRATAFAEVGGFDPNLIAGEEPDLGQRLRAAGGTLVKLPDDMVLHDVDLMRYSQWWKRSVRWGYAAAQLAHRHGLWRGRHEWYTLLNSLSWAAGLPAATLLCLRVTPLASVAAAAYPARVARLYFRGRRNGQPHRLALAHAVLNTVDKVSELVGAVRYGRDALTGQRSRIIEHKRPSARSPLQP